MKDYFYGFDYSPFSGESNKERLNILLKGVNYILGHEEEEKKLFVREATALSQAESLCRSLLSDDEKREIEYFKGIKLVYVKLPELNVL